MADQFHDPNNHVPEVAPGDDWGDEGVDGGGNPGSASILPRKRPQQEKPPGKFYEPNNHAPELAPDDDWGDADSARAGGPALPRKRSADEKPAFREVKDDSPKGIEIGVRVVEESDAPKSTKATAHRLEVQELAPKQTVIESAPSPSPLPKVVPKQVIEKMEIPAGEESEIWSARATDAENWGKQRKVSFRWMVITGAILGVVLITIAILLPRMGWKGEKRTKSYFSQLEIDDTPVLPTEANVRDLPENAQEQAMAVATTYANAKSLEEVLPLVRDRARVEPLMRERWKAFPVNSTWKVPDEAQWSIQKAGEREFGHLTGLLPDFNPFQMFFVREGDKVVVDWEASSGFSETAFADLSKNQGAGGVTRGVLAPGDLYTFSLPEGDYQCYRVTSPDREIGIWCYVKRDSPHAEKIAALFQQSAIPREMFNEYPVTLKLEKAPADSLPNQWVIAEMLHIDWITP